MAFARARAARTLQTSFRRSAPRVSAPGRTQLVQRRWASGGGHGHAESGSDLPWALAGVVVTIPSCWYLWPDSSHADAGHHGHGDKHEEEHEESGEEKGDEGTAEEPKDEESGPLDEAKPETEQEQVKEEKADAEKVDGEEEKKDEGNGADAKEGSAETGSTKPTSEVQKTDDKPTKEEANDSEGAEVKKVQKDRVIRKTLPSSGQPLGKSPQEGETEGVAKGSGGSMESKQAGMSNTQAKHSIPIGDSPDKSKKPEGGPDTAKASGTVAVKRHD